MSENARLLVLDDDPLVRKSLRAELELADYSVTTSDTFADAHQKVVSDNFAVILADVRLPDGTAFDLLEFVNEKNLPAAVVLFTGYGSVEDAVRAVKQGAFDYITKPLSEDEVQLTVERALERQKLLEENNQLRRQLNMSFQMENFVCQDSKMQRVVETVKTVAGTDSTVLITGESGTGKTMVARAIHANSPRAGEPFLEVNCGTLPDTLLESELFGHVKGAFSGAVANKKGKFEAADGGSLFLDEISLASPSLQNKLLRVLESFKFEPVGSNDTRHADVRVILATNQDLKALVEKRDFREDLYYRINVMDIHIPPLRKRPDDVLPLAQHFVEKHQNRALQEVNGFSNEAMRILSRHNWPGNVRELENVVEKALVLCGGPYIRPEDLDVGGDSDDTMSPDGEILPLKEAMKQVEKRLLECSLEHCDGNKKEAARLLEINRTTLYNKLHEHDLMDD